MNPALLIYIKAKGIEELMPICQYQGIYGSNWIQKLRKI
jgi:hypothetical protein